MDGCFCLIGGDSMTFEECLELVMAYGQISEELGKQTNSLERNTVISRAAENMADFIASMMASNGGRIRHDCEPV